MKPPSIAALILSKSKPGMPKAEPEEMDEMGEEQEHDEALISAAEELMEALGVSFPSTSDRETRVEREVKRTKAKVVADILRDVFEILESKPHEEGKAEVEPEEDEE